MATITYIVTKAFTYAGTPFQQGQTWEPQGSRNDAAIIAGRFVVAKAQPPRKAGKA